MLITELECPLLSLLLHFMTCFNETQQIWRLFTAIGGTTSRRVDAFGAHVAGAPPEPVGRRHGQNELWPRHWRHWQYRQQQPGHRRQQYFPADQYNVTTK